MMFRPAMNIPQ